MTRILQIVPASGWRAVHASRSEGGGVALRAERVAVWGLVEDDCGRSVCGFAGEDLSGPCENVEGFVGYVHDSGHPEALLQEAETVLRILEGREARRAV